MYYFIFVLLLVVHYLEEVAVHLSLTRQTIRFIK